MKFSCIFFASVAAILCSTGISAAAVRVAGADVKLRNGPGVEYAVIAVVPEGAAVDVRNCTPNWCRVRYRSDEGWANSAYLGTGYGSGPAMVEREPYSGPFGVETEPYYDDGYGLRAPFGYGHFVGGPRHFGGRRHFRVRGRHVGRVGRVGLGSPAGAHFGGRTGGAHVAFRGNAHIPATAAHVAAHAGAPAGGRAHNS